MLARASILAALMSLVFGISVVSAQASDLSADHDSVTLASTVDPPPGAWGPGDFPSDLGSQTYLGISGVSGQQGLTRQYKVHVPPSYSSDKSMPLVFCLHGLDQNAVMFCVNATDVNGVGSIVTVADQEGFILVMPNGYKHSWNAGSCCNGAQRSGVDDVALMRAILAEVEKHLNVDASRVYSAGLSNGAFMSFRLACEASDMIAAIIDSSGAIEAKDIVGGSGDFATCKPAHPVSVLSFHGTKDRFVPYGDFQKSVPYFAQQDGCSASTTPASFPNSGGDTSCVTYTGCPAGVTVSACTVDGGGHCWFGSKSCGTGGGLAGAIGKLFVGKNSDTTVETNDVWPFLKDHKRD